jgi:hypothetical protein
MSDKKWLKDSSEERLVKCYSCDGKGYVPGSYAYEWGLSHYFSICLVACKECSGFGSVVLKPIDQAATLFEEEALMPGKEGACLS